MFPNYDVDSATPVINRVLLLDRGDWVPYHNDQDVNFNIMDKDEQGVQALVINRGDTTVETIDNPGKGVIKRSFSTCGDYTAHSVMSDRSRSEACRFSVCDLDFRLPGEETVLGKSWEIDIHSDNMKVIILYFNRRTNSYEEHNVFVTEQQRKDGKVVIPASLIQDKGRMQVWLIGENKYGRLKKHRDISIVE